MNARVDALSREALGTLSEQERLGLEDHAPTERYTNHEATEERLYMALVAARAARLTMQVMETRKQDTAPEWYYQADARRIALDDARRYYTRMVTHGWAISATCAALVKWERVL